MQTNKYQYLKQNMRTNPKMKVQKYNHFTITVLVKCVFDVIVQNFNLVSTNTCIHKSIDMSFQSPRKSFLNNIGTNIQVL